jgi:hypothetical protein
MNKNFQLVAKWSCKVSLARNFKEFSSELAKTAAYGNENVFLKHNNCALEYSPFGRLLKRYSNGVILGLIQEPSMSNLAIHTELGLGAQL